MSSFTCIACQVAFSNFEGQREHYKTDWHRYNLKRKVAELPPVTAENFNQRVLAQRSQVQTGNEATPRYCNFCRKNFSSENAYVNHLKAKKHLEMVEKGGVSAMETSVQQKNLKNVMASTERKKKDEVNALKKMVTDNKNKTPDAASSCSGMSNVAAKGSETDDDEEMEEWDETEVEPLGLEECLFCSHLSTDLEANVKHMTEAHSFFIPDVEYLVDLEGLIACLAEKVGVGCLCLWCNDKGKAFYTVKSAQQHMVDKGHCKILHEKENLWEYAEFYDYSASFPDHEDPAVDPDQEVQIDVLNDEDYLVLPSGAVIWHRSWMQYYRRNKAPIQRPASKRVLHTVMSHYRALGWTAMTGEAAMRKARDISLMHMRRSKQHLHVGIKNNKCLQKHFRQQNPI